MLPRLRVRFILVAAAITSAVPNSFARARIVLRGARGSNGTDVRTNHTIDAAHRPLSNGTAAVSNDTDNDDTMVPTPMRLVQLHSATIANDITIVTSMKAKGITIMAARQLVIA